MVQTIPLLLRSGLGMTSSTTPSCTTGVRPETLSFSCLHLVGSGAKGEGEQCLSMIPDGLVVVGTDISMEEMAPELSRDVKCKRDGTISLDIPLLLDMEGFFYAYNPPHGVATDKRRQHTQHVKPHHI
ncbi:hypothetical protein IV203_036842 [Nitzschia inconspicua]|uniref:Uncharacterized protein n=1 Tax=Nitzschia inconspicua TaxID=303405 RepID=A0A9K3LH22_9STRA|nr:hypothetical protein IV203_036840 [Nitzschia inconspicua]KAG7361740.1 hypothetical protein IV203_036841 [Nitzschia inconspicua]KAG7361741.1 hypothetical protein IV203_036842 [Nitzschia inconspicua]